MDTYVAASQQLFSFSNLPAHLSYVLIAISYYLTNMFWLRLVAVAGLLLEIVYFRLSGGNLLAGIGWDVVFIIINAYQMAWLVRDRLSLRLPEADAPLLRKALGGLDDAQIARLLKAAEWKSIAAGDALTTQDKPLDVLYFLLSGSARVDVKGAPVTTLQQGAFVGEIAYLTGNPATATVTAAEPCRVLVFNKQRMAKVVAADHTINSIVFQLLGRDLAAKLSHTNMRHGETGRSILDAALAG